jgi:DNA-binding transcriptional LysR family regulator
MSQPSLKDLRLALVVAETGNFRIAARRLEIAASTLSHAITGLEQTLKLRLFHRTTRSVALTAEGQAFLARMRPILEELDEVLADNGSQKDDIAGELRINTPFNAATYLLREVVPAFLAQHPGVQLELRHEERPVDIVAERCDAGIRLGATVPPDMIAVPFGGKTRFVPVAAPAYLQKRGVPAHPQELMNHTCVRIRMPQGQRYAWEFVKDGEMFRMDVPGSLTLDRVALTINAAESGLGIAFVLEHAAKESIAAGKLHTLLTDWCPLEEGYMLYYPGRRHVPPPLKALVEFLKASRRA